MNRCCADLLIRPRFYWLHLSTTVLFGRISCSYSLKERVVVRVFVGEKYFWVHRRLWVWKCLLPDLVGIGIGWLVNVNNQKIWKYHKLCTHTFIVVKCHRVWFQKRCCFYSLNFLPRSILTSMPTSVGVVILNNARLLFNNFGSCTGTCHCRAKENVDNQHEKEEYA